MTCCALSPKNGGVVQTNFYDAFIDENYRKAAEAQMKDAEAAVERARS